MTEFFMEKKEVAGIAVLECEGRMDSDCFNYCRKIINSLIEEKDHKIIFDLNKVTYVSSTGWAIFISSLKKVREAGGDIKLANMRMKAKYIFDILELENVIDAFATVEEALEAFMKKSARTDIENG